MGCTAAKLAKLPWLLLVFASVVKRRKSMRNDDADDDDDDDDDNAHDNAHDNADIDGKNSDDDDNNNK